MHKRVHITYDVSVHVLRVRWMSDENFTVRNVQIKDATRDKWKRMDLIIEIWIQFSEKLNYNKYKILMKKIFLNL